MIQNNQELETTLERIEHFQKIVEKLKAFETNPRNYELSAGGFLAEIDRMRLEVRHYLLINMFMDVNRSKKYTDELFPPSLLRFTSETVSTPVPVSL